MRRLQLLCEQVNNMPQPRKIKILGVIAFVCYSLAMLFLVIFVFGGTRTRAKDLSSVVVFVESSPAGLMALRYLAKRADVSIAMIVLTVDAWSFNINAAYDNIVAFLSTLKTAKELRYNIPVYYGNSAAQVNAKFDEDITFAGGGSGGGGKTGKATSCTYRRVIQPELILEADRLFGASDVLDTVQFFEFSNNSGESGNDGYNSRLGNVSSEHFVFFETPLADYLSRHKATFLVLGPSTDAASFLQRHADLGQKVTRVVIAGGAVSSAGDTHLVYPRNAHSEQHMFFDPHAANYLLSGAHGRPVVLLPLNAAPQWPPKLYDSLIVSRAAEAAPPPAALPAHVVALGFVGFSRRIGDGRRLPHAVLAALYFADAATREKAAVAEMSLLVAHGVTLAEDGMLGTAAKTEWVKQRGDKDDGNDFKVQVVMRIVEDRFWSRFESLDRLRHSGKEG